MTKIGLLRVSYWIGAIADLIVGIAMVYPKFLALVLRLEEPPLAIETRCALGIGASLMFGWTALLLWADRKPLQRKGVLVLTVAVILGLAFTILYGFLGGYIPLASALSVWVFQTFLIALFLLAYALATKENVGAMKK
jgi:hypothetical protein